MRVDTQDEWNVARIEVEGQDSNEVVQGVGAEQALAAINKLVSNGFGAMAYHVCGEPRGTSGWLYKFFGGPSSLVDLTVIVSPVEGGYELAILDDADSEYLFMENGAPAIVTSERALALVEEAVASVAVPTSANWRFTQ